MSLIREFRARHRRGAALAVAAAGAMFASMLILVGPAYAGTGAIAGNVTEPGALSSQPVAGAGVECWYETEAGTAVYRAWTDANGMYTLSDVVEGTHWCMASKGGYYMSDTRQVTVSPGETSRADFEIYRPQPQPDVPLPPFPLCLHHYCQSPIPR